MNNATVALHVARPASTAAGSSALGKANDDASPSNRFDAAMDAARATHATQAPVRQDAHVPTRADRRRDASDDDSASTQVSKDGTTDTATAAKSADDARPATVKADTKSDDDATKKADASGDDDTSLASAMLALIGVPPKVTELAGKALGTLTEATGKAGAAIGDAVGLPGMAALAVDGARGVAKDGTLALPDAGASAAVAAPVATSPFAALLAGAGAGAAVPGTKYEAVKATDPTTSPMPLTHTPGLAPVDGTVVQVQATQVATSPQFAQELGEQIAWMGNGQIKEARIKLHPEELGSMDVRVNIDGSKVNVAIMAQHPAAVHAVQQTLAQLDTLLAHHGLSLGQADVGQRGPGQGGDSPAGGNGGQDGTEDAAVGSVMASSRVSRSLVDEVA